MLQGIMSGFGSVLSAKLKLANTPIAPTADYTSPTTLHSPQISSLNGIKRMWKAPKKMTYKTIELKDDWVYDKESGERRFAIKKLEHWIASKLDIEIISVSHAFDMSHARCILVVYTGNPPFGPCQCDYCTGKVK